MAGGIFTGANLEYVLRELVHQLENTGDSFLLYGTSSLDAVIEAALLVALSRSQTFVFDGRMKPGPMRSGVDHWSCLLAGEDEGRIFEWSPCTKPGEYDETVVLKYSSGITGLPKGL
ncbi:hypothetical protein MMC14_003241 [Varicellaria rhodocarpa]|nr:hypothetical protein [Varicellaria rhodocarpa]